MIPDEIAKKIFSEINLVDDKHWLSRSSFRERKKEFVKLDIGGKILSDITEAFHSQRTDLITKITKIEELESDPSLFAGITRMISMTSLTHISIIVMIVIKEDIED